MSLYIYILKTKGLACLKAFSRSSATARSFPSCTAFHNVLWGSGFGLQGLGFRDKGRALRIEDQDLEFRSHENAVFMHGSHICMHVN